MHVLGLWVETGERGENPRRHRDNTPTPHRAVRGQESNPQASFCDRHCAILSPFRETLSFFSLALPQWHPLLVSLCETVTAASGSSFNSLLCNLYRDGHDSIGWHSDDEASLGAEPTIASLSLGDTRVFSLRKKPPPVRLVT